MTARPSRGPSRMDRYGRHRRYSMHCNHRMAPFPSMILQIGTLGVAIRTCRGWSFSICESGCWENHEEHISFACFCYEQFIHQIIFSYESFTTFCFNHFSCSRQSFVMFKSIQKQPESIRLFLFRHPFSVLARWSLTKGISVLFTQRRVGENKSIAMRWMANALVRRRPKKNKGVKFRISKPSLWGKT